MGFDSKVCVHLTMFAHRTLARSLERLFVLRTGSGSEAVIQLIAQKNSLREWE